MRKARATGEDELRVEYKRSDFGPLVRGKYAARAARASNVVVLDPRVASEFPNDRAVNSALRGVLLARRRTAATAARSGRARTRAARSG